MQNFKNTIEFVQNDSISLNLARNCFRYVIKAFGIKKIHMPYYTCPVMWQAAHKECCKIEFYRIDADFMPTKNFKEDDFILYSNYFGICAKNIKTLTERYKNLVVDNAHAFFMPPIGIASFNSLRKFFDVPDGAVLTTSKLLSQNFEQDISSHMDISNFEENEINLSKKNIMLMSEYTRKTFSQIDLNAEKNERLRIFNLLSDEFGKNNKLKIELDTDDVPMSYPFWCEDLEFIKKLNTNNIKFEHYWNPLPKKYIEGQMQKFIVALPLNKELNIFDIKKAIV